MWATFFCICILVLFLHILCLVGVSSRHFRPNHVFPTNNLQGSLQNQHSLQMTPFSFSDDHKGIMGSSSSVEKEEKYKKLLGSKPPRCDHKCYGCIPCEAIQVPTNVHVGVGVLYTNYEPEGWKCKCGPTFYTP